MRERLSSTITVLSESSTEIKLDVSHSLDPSIYIEPLTLRSTLPPDWLTVKVQQGEDVYVVSSITEGLETAIYYNVVPNMGPITLTPTAISPTEVISLPSFLSGPESGIPQTSYTYSTGGSASNFDHAIEYQFDWKGDGTTDLSPWGSATQSKIWRVAGSYNVRSRAHCGTHPGVISLWTSPIVVNITEAIGNAFLELNFEEGSGNTAVDTSGNGNNGTINGAVYTTDGAVGSYALSFDGNDSVTVPANATLKPSNISVAFWVKHTIDTTSPNYEGIIQGAYGGGYSTGFRVLDYNNQPLAQVNFGNAEPIRILGNPFVLGAWCHLVLTYDHAKIRLYQDGVLVREIAETRNINWNTTPSDFRVGFAQWYFKGAIDKVKIYSYALNSQEIAQLYAERGQAPAQYTLTVSIAGSGSVTKVPEKAQYNSGEVVQLTALPQAGWVFGGWSGDLTGNTNPGSITMDANKTVTATFVQTYSYVVTTNPSGLQFTVDGVAYTTPQTFIWEVGSTHTLSVLSPQNGVSGIRYLYNSWSDGGAQTHSVTAQSSNTTYTASFDTQYTLTTSVTASGGTVSPSGTNWYNSGQVVSISATAKAGYIFSGWSGDLSGSINPSSIMMTGPMSVRANFKKVRK
jgi:uncharacterized repeat protein (TIGR02543 family)